MEAVAAFIMLVVLPCLVITSAVMESKTYNRLTGAETTWWDALWVQLRVDGEVKKETK